MPYSQSRWRPKIAGHVYGDHGDQPTAVMAVLEVMYQLEGMYQIVLDFVRQDPASHGDAMRNS